MISKNLNPKVMKKVKFKNGNITGKEVESNQEVLEGKSEW